VAGGACGQLAEQRAALHKAVTGFNERAGLDCSWISGSSVQDVPVYLTSGYQSMLASYDHSEARLLRCESRGCTAYLPMLVRNLGNGRHEAYSAYGYGGLLGSLTLSLAEVDELRRFLAGAGIVALFLRHSPFLANQEQWPNGMVELNRRTYAAELRRSDSFDSYLKTIPQKLRWSVNYARRAGLRVSFQALSQCPPQRIQSFYRLYAGLMQQKQTSGYYLFSEAFFLEHASSLGEHCELAEIVDPGSGELIAAAFFLLDDSGWAHYHLSAATASAMKLQGMELLMASALQRYGNMDYRSMHLGGGHALDESDGLSRFKAKFADRKLDFCCTKLICDQAGYQTERDRLPLKHSNFFLISDARGY
jgi:Acetyltransferase (GNAT) domain